MKFSAAFLLALALGSADAFIPAPMRAMSRLVNLKAAKIAPDDEKILATVSCAGHQGD